MIETQYDGQKVAYVDPLGVTHTGVVIGGTADGEWLYVQSDRYKVADPQEWHFKVRVTTMPFVTA